MTEYNPTRHSPPSDTLRELIMLSPGTPNLSHEAFCVAYEDAPITADIALELEREFLIPKEWWLARDKQYRGTL